MKRLITVFKLVTKYGAVVFVVLELIQIATEKFEALELKEEKK